MVRELREGESLKIGDVVIKYPRGHRGAIKVYFNAPRSTRVTVTKDIDKSEEKAKL